MPVREDDLVGACRARRAGHGKAQRMVAATLAASALIVGCGSTQPATLSVNLNMLLLRPAQVGSGYHSGPQHRALAGHSSAGLCAANARDESLSRTESLRTARLQAVFLNPHPPQAQRVTISNEVIAYRSVAGAQQTMRELRHAAMTCPSGYEVSAITDTHLPAGYIALRVGIKGEPHIRVSIWIYQARNNVVSEIFATAPKGRATSRLPEVTLHAAEESARNLTTY